MAHFLCHLGAHILEPFCSISILPKTVLSIVLYLIISQHPFNENILLEMLMKNFCEFVKAQGLLSP